MLRGLFNSAYRRARRAEGAGDYRRAAALYVEADAPDEAAQALLFHAARASSAEERLAAWQDALRWLPEEHVKRPEVEGRIGRTLLDLAERRGPLGPQDRERLEDAAGRLERADRPAEAATAWELLGRVEDAARCLERAGEVERLEALLERSGERESHERRLRHLLSSYEMAERVGARLEARDALRRAAELAPEDPSVAELLRGLEARLPPLGRVQLQLDRERTTLLVGRLPAVVGRVDADVPLRGASVSRRHAELGRRGERVTVRDLGSRNGTLVQGVPIARAVHLGGPTEVGLGEDVTLRVEPSPGGGVRLQVVRGLDRGLEVLAGPGPLRPAGLGASIAFPEGHATLRPGKDVPVWLGEQRCAAPVTLLVGDVVHVGETRLEVRR